MWYQCNTVVKISIHALLAESDYGALKHVHEEEISIHALLAESDMLTDEVNSNNVISIHALLAESDIGSTG